MCPECDFAALAPSKGSGRSESLLDSGEPVEFLKDRLRSLAPGTKGIHSPRSLREGLRRAGFVGIEAKTRGSEVRRFLRRRIPILDARDGLEVFFRAEAGASGGASVEPPATRSLLGRLADACDLGPVLSVRARRP